MKPYITALWILNFIDTISTVLAINSGWAMEINPLTNSIINYNLYLFIIAKIVLVTACLAVFWFNRYNRIIRFSLPGITIIYAVLVLWHAILWSMVKYHGTDNIKLYLEDDQCQIETLEPISYSL